MFPERSEAVVELQAAGVSPLSAPCGHADAMAQDVGKLLLLPDGAIQINDSPVTLSALSDAKLQSNSNSNGASGSAAPAGLMPRVFTQRGRGRGKGRGRGGLGSKPGLGAQGPSKATDMEE